MQWIGLAPRIARSSYQMSKKQLADANHTLPITSYNTKKIRMLQWLSNRLASRSGEKVTMERARSKSHTS